MRSIQKKSWSSFGTNIRVDQSKLTLKNVTAIASVSSKRGLIYLKIQDDAVNADSF